MHARCFSESKIGSWPLIRTKWYLKFEENFYYWNLKFLTSKIAWFSLKSYEQFISVTVSFCAQLFIATCHITVYLNEINESVIMNIWWLSHVFGSKIIFTLKWILFDARLIPLAIKYTFLNNTFSISFDLSYIKFDF